MIEAWLADLASSTHAKVLALGILAVSAGSCATLSSQKGEAKEAISHGDYLAASSFYNEKLCAEKELPPEDKDNCDIVAMTKKSMVRYLVARGRHVTRYKGADERFNNYPWAIDYYRRALAIDPNNEAAKKELEAIETLMSRAEKSYAAIFAQLQDRLSSDAPYDEAMHKEIRKMLDDLRKLSELLKKKAYDPISLLLQQEEVEEDGDGNLKVVKREGLVRRLINSEQIKWAFEITQSAEDFVNGSEIVFRTEDEQFVSTVSDAFREGVSNGEITLRLKARVRHRANPKDAKRARVVSIPVVPAAKVAPNGNGNGNLEAEALKAVESALAKVQRDFENGRVFEALVGIDQEIGNLAGNPQVGKLEEQRAQWASARKDLVEKYLGKAGEAFVNQRSAEALEGYRKVLKIDPQNSTANERIPFLEKRVK